MKKILLSLSTLLLIPTAFAAVSYPDVNEDMPYFKAIDVFTAENIIEGYSDGTFKPDNEINRAEAMKVILLAMPEAVDPVENNFSDVFEDQWFIDFVRDAVARDIVEGYPDGTFKPAQQVNMAEALKMALFAKGISQEEMVYTEFHPSVTEDDWYAKYFSYGYDRNLFDLDLEGNLDPVKPMTRGEFVDLVYRVKNFGLDADFDISYNWKEQVSSAGLEVKIPFYWNVYELESGFFLGYFEDNNPQFIHMKPNSVKVAFTYWNNPDELTASSYFSQIMQDYEADYDEDAFFEESIALDGPSLLIEIPDEDLIDYYVYLEDGRLLAGNAVYDGDSLKAENFVEEIKKVYQLANFVSESGFLDANQKLNEVRENLLVSGTGMDMINLFDDPEIIETDTLGVGTGPIDYYYVEEIDHTFKYERANDVILDLKEGSTSAF